MDKDELAHWFRICARFWDKVQITKSCWNWQASKHQGYGRFRFNGTVIYAHRFSYKLFKGDIPNDKVLDHLCRNSSCINPDHLEVVTQQENCKRGEVGLHTIKTKKGYFECGHSYTLDNMYFIKSGRSKGRGICKQCAKIRAINSQNKLKIKPIIKNKESINRSKRIYRNKMKLKKEMEVMF